MSVTRREPPRLIAAVSDIARSAGEIVLGFYRRPIEVTAKSDKTPLTAADRASHDYLCSELSRLTPGLTIVSEEADCNDKSILSQASEAYWLIDPLDGTKEFLKGTNEFTINIALIENSRPVLGVVVAPALGVTYLGSRGDGAWRERNGNAQLRIRTRRADSGRLALVASKDHAGPQVAAVLARTSGAEVRNMGSSLKFCLVAEGEADLYLRDVPTMEWDTAAAQCVVEAAGGLVCDLAGHTLAYGKVDRRNPEILTLGDPRFDWHDFLAGSPL